MKKIRRAIHFDFHTLPGIYDFNRGFDPVKFAETLVKAKVDYINLTAKCNTGFSYFDTKIGVKYPNMKGDMFGDTLRECKKRGITVIAYLNMGLDHIQAHKHRDWCRVNADSQVVYGNKTGPFSRVMCLNTGYKDYALSLLKELVENYDIDGVFLDTLEPLRSCYGSECTDEIIAQGGNPEDAETVHSHSIEVYKRFCIDAKKIVGNDKYFYTNGSVSFFINDLISHCEIECLTSSPFWGYELFAAQAAYCRNLKEQLIFMTGRFQGNWGDFGGFKGKAAIENDLWESFCYGVQATSIGDHLHPAENLNPYIYDTISEIYNETAKLDDWLDDSKYLAEIGVILSKPYYEMRNNHKGLARMFGELKIPFDIVDAEMEFDKYKLIILPDDVLITPLLKDRLETYLANGGKVISSGISGLNEQKTDFALDAWKQGFIFKGLDTSTSAYMRFNEHYKTNPPQMDFSLYNHGIRFETNAKSTSFADYVKAYFDRRWDGVHGHYYTPPEKKTGESAAAICNNVIHICFNIFEAYYKNALKEHKDLIKYCLDHFYNEPLIKDCDLPSTARATLTVNPKAVNLHVKITFPETRGEKHIIEEHQSVLPGHTLKVRGEYSKAYSAPDLAPMNIETKDGYTKITLPAITGYKLIALEK